MKAKIIMASAIVAALACGCSDQIISSKGEGSITLSASVNTDMKVVSRSLADDLMPSTTIWIAKTGEPNALIRQYKGMDQVPTSPIALLSGSYMARAWAGDSVTATFDNDHRFFKASVPFTVTDGANTRVELPLKIANVGVSVVYGENVADVLSNCKLTVKNTRGSLDFEGETADKRGYFMMPKDDNLLEYTLTGVQVDGSSFSKSGQITDPQGGTEYVLTVVYTTEDTQLGGAYLTIEIDESEMTSEEDVTIVAAPSITGYGFDINKPINGEAGQIGRRCVYIGSATALTEIELASELLAPIVGGNDVNLLRMNESVKDALEAGGIDYSITEQTEGSKVISTLVQINFEEEFTETMVNGVYTFTIKAVDALNHHSNATMTFNVSSDPVEISTHTIADHGAYSATLRGTLRNADVVKAGFNYRAKTLSRAGEDWQYVDAERNGNELTARLTDLTPGTEYEYTIVADDFTGTKVQSFTTDPVLQLPNAGFEEWNTSNKTYLICTDEGSMYWDSGNHGATTMGSSITTPDSEMKHSGNYGAKLLSKFIGIGTIGKFAAGNLFAGRYLATDGTDGILGWGRPFNSRPTAVKVWAKYVPQAAVNKKGALNGYIAEGQLDKGIIYMALTDETMMDVNFSGSINGSQTQWPQVVKTKSSTQQLFRPNDAKVIAYGEHVFETATEGSDLIEITIPLDYKRTDVIPSNVIFVASASRYGDYFSGGEGSVLYIDDIELIYE